MRLMAVLACMSLLNACTTDTGPTGELEEIALGQVPANGIIFFPPALSAFKSNPLATETFDPSTGPAELTSLPFDEETRKFIKYTVECALDLKQEVKFQGDVYTGLMAECPAWNQNVPNTTCLEAVSGCLLARQNPTGKRVRFSPRGLLGGGGYFDAFQYALADTYKEDPLGTKIDSFWKSCSAGETGEGRDCGWTAETSFTGTCEPGASVSLGAGARMGLCGAPLGFAGLPDEDMVLRVCEGMSGCNSSDLTHLGSSNDECDRNPAVDFTCPSGGVFSAMLSSNKPGEPFGGSVGADSGATVAYPSLIADLFTMLEGSFYGNMFTKINPNVTLVSLGPKEGYVIQLKKGDEKHTGYGSPQVFPFEDAWCCHDPAYDPSYLDNGRACSKQPVLDPGGKPGEANLCVCRPLGECNKLKAEKNARSSRCPIYDQNPVIGDVDHDDCRDGSNIPRKWPMTVFLHDPCDMVTDENRTLCALK